MTDILLFPGKIR